MRRFEMALSVFAALGAGALSQPAVAAGEAEKDVLAAMDAWKQATMKKDRALFEKVYHPDLSYGHSSGLIETKAQAIEHVVGSKVVYEGIDLTESKVTLQGSNTAVLTGKAVFRQRSESNKPNVVNLVYLSVWTKGKGGGWQMLARQATRPPEAAATAAAAAPAAKKP
jgi:ketosteroid isomerase-like protein